VSMPYVEKGRKMNAVTWWGDRQATVDYCKVNLPRICKEFGGDLDNLFICGFSRGAIGASYIGLADDEIAALWKGMFTHDHFDGQTPWDYPESDRKSALARLRRLKGRPVLICGQSAGKVRDDFLKDHLDLARFTFLDVPTTKIFNIPEGKIIHAHTDLWMHRESQYRVAARAWLREVRSSTPSAHAPQIKLGELKLIYTEDEIPIRYDGSLSTLRKDGQMHFFHSFGCRIKSGQTRRSRHSWHRGPPDDPLKCHVGSKTDKAFWDYNGYYQDQTEKGIWILFSSPNGLDWSLETTVDQVDNGLIQPYSTFVDFDGPSADCHTVDDDFYIYFPRKGPDHDTDHMYRRRITVEGMRKDLSQWRASQNDFEEDYR
jgi:hypothetical protein